MGRVVVRCLLAVGVVAVCAFALARVPAQFEVVEQFAVRLSAGNILQVRLLLPTEAVLTEYGLHLESAAGTAAHGRLRELVAQGARLEVAFESASADGALITTRDRLWLDDMPESLLPLRSTSVYLVEGERLLSVTRVLDADQRDVLMREAIVGDWRTGGYLFHYHADGTYDFVTGTRPYDSGAYAIEGRVIRFVSDEQTAGCRPGDVGLWRVSFTNPDRHMIEKIEDMCTVGRAGTLVHFTRITE